MNKIKIYSGTSHVKAMGIKNILESEGIEFHAIDRSDTAYSGLLGEIEIYINASEEAKAAALIQDLKD